MIHDKLAEMVPIPTPLPQKFLKLAGYLGRERFLGTWYESSGAILADGRSAISYSYRQAYAPLVGHWSVAFYLTKTGANLGSDDSFATEMMILDTEKSRIYLATREQGRSLLRLQCPNAEDARGDALIRAVKMFGRLENARSVADYQESGMFECFFPAIERADEIREMEEELNRSMPTEAREALDRFANTPVDSRNPGGQDSNAV